MVVMVVVLVAVAVVAVAVAVAVAAAAAGVAGVAAVVVPPNRTAIMQARVFLKSLAILNRNAFKEPFKGSQYQ